jgi:hypothetical protein
MFYLSEDLLSVISELTAKGFAVFVGCNTLEVCREANEGEDGDSITLWAGSPEELLAWYEAL